MPPDYKPVVQRRQLLLGVAASALFPSTLLAQTRLRQAVEPGLPPPLRLQPLPKPATLRKPRGTSFLFPAPPVYPVFDDPRTIVDQANEISRALEAYIIAWLEGRALARIPPAYLPPGINTADFRSFTLMRPEDIDPREQWVRRPAETLDRNRGYRGSFPDPNCTYLLIPQLLAPFGSQVVVEGSFPYARFFDLQMTPSLDPYSYRYDAVGVGVDIDPLPGSTNPFRVGARRDAQRRDYRVTFDMRVGDPVALNPAFRPPNFRGRGNNRIGGAILFRGAWGLPRSGGDKRGPFQAGELWGRYYRIDDGVDPDGGVPLPRVHCMLPDGRRFWIQADQSVFQRRVDQRVFPKVSAPAPDRAHREGPDYGWLKQAGIFRSIAAGIAANTGWAGAEYVRLLDKGVAGRGSDLPPPNNYEQSATSATYIDYLVRGMSCERDHVVVLTGKLPTFPDTARGGPMTAAQMRYWSIVGYAVAEGWDFLDSLKPNAIFGAATHVVRDDEIVLDRQRNYVIALSRPNDRPANATANNGVTWRDWGPAGKISWTLRWLTVGPEWKGRMTPSPELLGRRAEDVEPAFDRRAISTNSHDGVLGTYLPRIHYLPREQFEAIGTGITMQDIPIWT
jgi:hypothetical protein